MNEKSLIGYSCLANTGIYYVLHWTFRVFFKTIFGTHAKNDLVFVESKKLQKVGFRVLANLIPPVTMADKNIESNDNEIVKQL